MMIERVIIGHRVVCDRMVFGISCAEYCDLFVEQNSYRDGFGTVRGTMYQLVLLRVLRYRGPDVSLSVPVGTGQSGPACVAL